MPNSLHIWFHDEFKIMQHHELTIKHISGLKHEMQEHLVTFCLIQKHNRDYGSLRR